MDKKLKKQGRHYSTAKSRPITWVCTCQAILLGSDLTRLHVHKVQMTRGAIVIFTALFSVVLLGRKQYAYHLAGVAMVLSATSTCMQLQRSVSASTGKELHSQPYMSGAH
eukprot:1619428-Amphidinium_carterae.1